MSKTQTKSSPAGSRQPRFKKLALATAILMSTSELAAEPVDLNIPAGLMEATLNRLAQTAGVALVIKPEQLKGLKSEGLQGTYSVEHGFDELLKDSGFSAKRTENGYVLVKRSNQSAAKESIIEAPEQLSQITVIGTKQDRSLQDTPKSVALFDQQRIESQVMFNIDDVLQRTPNVSMSNVQTSFSIRGISQSGVTGIGVANTATVYVDGAPLSSNGSQQGVQSLWDVQQVEVLRGPQSTVQGRNALAGGIVIKTNLITIMTKPCYTVYKNSIDNYFQGVSHGSK